MAVWKGSPNFNTGRNGSSVDRIVIHYIVGTLAAADATILSERRERAPYGLAGGEPGQPGENRLIRADGTEELLPGKASFDVQPGDVLSVRTPGGGGWGEAESSTDGTDFPEKTDN